MGSCGSIVAPATTHSYQYECPTVINRPDLYKYISLAEARQVLHLDEGAMESMYEFPEKKDKAASPGQSKGLKRTLDASSSTNSPKNIKISYAPITTELTAATKRMEEIWRKNPRLPLGSLIGGELGAAFKDFGQTSIHIREGRKVDELLLQVIETAPGVLKFRWVQL